MFANAVFLWGLLGIGVPVLIHLIYRRKRLAVDYPTLMFFQRVDMKLASRRKIKEILLLILRAAAVALVALALARPGFRTHAQGGGSADCVIVIDNSASMGLPAHAGTRLELARAQATAILNVLGTEGRAAILATVPGDAAAEVGTLSVDRERLSQALQALSATNGSGSITGALARAKELFGQTSSGLNREVYILSDFHGNLFKDQTSLREAVNGLPDNTNLFLCPVAGGPPGNNASLVNLAIDPRPKVAGRVMRVVATVKNNSMHEMTMAVTATLRDAKPQSANVTLVAGATQDVPLLLTLGQEGFTFGDVKLDNDDAPYDNVWPFCLEIRGPIRALVVSAVAPRKAEQGEAFFLLKALDPTGDGRISGLKVENVTPDKMPKDFDAYDAVLLCGTRALAPAAIKSLEGFVQHGGGLMIFSSTPDAALAANHPLQPLFGGKILGTFDAIGNQKPFGLQVLRPASPFFDDCRQQDGSVEFPEVAVMHALKTEAAPDTEVLAQYSNGQPAIMVRKYGLGRIMWWTTSAHSDDSNLPMMPQFLSFLHRSVSVFAGAQGVALTQQAGHPLIFDLSARAKKDIKAAYPDALTIFDPTEKSFEVPVVGGRVTWRQTGRAGVYRMAAKGADGKGPTAGLVPVPPGFALTPDPDESAPEYKTADEAKRALGNLAAIIVDPSADFQATVLVTRQGKELFGYFILAALLVILAEVVIANMLGVRIKSVQPPLMPITPSRGVPSPGLSLSSGDEHGRDAHATEHGRDAHATKAEKPVETGVAP